MRVKWCLLWLLAATLLTSTGCDRSPRSDGAGAAGEMPSVRQAEPVEIPQAIRPAGGAFAVYMRMRDPNTTVDRLGAWTSLAQPTFDGTAIRGHLASQGLDLAQFQPGRDAVIAIWPQINFAQQSVPVAGILPLTPNAQLDHLGLQTERLEDGDVLFSAANDPQSAAMAQQARPSLLALRDTPMISDLELFFDLESLMAMYGPMLRQFVPMMIGSGMQMMQPAAPISPELNNIIMAEFSAMMDLLDQMGTLVVRVDFNPDALDVSTVVEARPTTALASALNAGPIQAPELTRFLGRQDFSGQMTITNVQHYNDIVMKYIVLALPNQPELVEQLRTLLSGWEGVGAVTTAFSGTTRADRPMQVRYIMAPDNAEFLMSRVSETLNTFEQGPLPDFYQRLGMNLQISEPAQRNYRGLTIHSYRVTLTPTEQASAIDRQMMESMFAGEMPFEIVRWRDLVLATIGDPVDALVDSLMDGVASEPARSVASAPAGGVFYMDFDFIGYMRSIEAAMQGASGQTAPAGVPALVTGFHQNGRGWYRLSIPREAFLLNEDPQ